MEGKCLVREENSDEFVLEADGFKLFSCFSSCIGIFLFFDHFETIRFRIVFLSRRGYMQTIRDVLIETSFSVFFIFIFIFSRQ